MMCAGVVSDKAVLQNVGLREKLGSAVAVMLSKGLADSDNAIKKRCQYSPVSRCIGNGSR